MEKVLRRTALAKSQAKRKARILAEKETTRDRVQYRIATGTLLRGDSHTVRQARKIRRQDWELGALAPWRESSLHSPTARIPYATWSVNTLHPPKVPEAYRVKDWFIREGDRVCVVEGRENIKGKIGKVVSVDKESEVVTVEGVNMVDVRIPAAMLEPGAKAIHSTAAPLPLSSVRLVYPLPDSVTGIPRDCILSNLVKRETRFDVYENETVWSRILIPQNIRIPWPDTDDPAHQDEVSDTLRIDVDEKTFLPTLLRPPMPLSLIDELRNKYSKFRERHDEEWVASKRAEDEQIDQVNSLGERMRPRGARNIARTHPSSWGGGFMARRAVPKLSEKTLETLGAHMAAVGLAKNKPKSGDVTSVPDITSRTTVL